MMRIAYCAGHGLHTPGKRTPAGEREWTFNNENAIAFSCEMSKYEGVELLRTDDSTGQSDVPLSTRTNKANGWGADIYISFHHNAHNGQWGEHTGSEVYYWDGNNEWTEEAKSLANKTLEAIICAYGLRNRGIKRYDFHICRESNCPAILIEGGFMDSNIDIQVMRNKEKTAALGTEVAKAVAKLYNLKKKEVPALKPKYGIFTLNEADYPAVEEIIAKVPGAVKFDWHVTPTEMFEEVVQVGGKKVRENYIHRAGKDREETMEKVRKWIEEQ